jgi:hypothetical protein
MAIGCSFLNMHDVNNLELMDSISREETHNGWREADVPTQSGRPGRQSTRQVTDDYCGQTVRGARSLDRQSRQPSRSMKKQRSNDDQSVVQTTPRFTCPSRHRRSRSRHPLPELAHVWALSHWIASASENANCCTSTWSDPDGFALRGRRERLESETPNSWWHRRRPEHNIRLVDHSWASCSAIPIFMITRVRRL